MSAVAVVLTVTFAVAVLGITTIRLFPRLMSIDIAPLGRRLGFALPVVFVLVIATRAFLWPFNQFVAGAVVATITIERLLALVSDQSLQNFGKKLWQTLVALVLILLGTGMGWASLEELSAARSLAAHGIEVPAIVHESKVDTRRVRRRTTVRYNTTFVFGENSWKGTLDRELPTGATVRLVYSASRPQVFRLQGHQPSAWGYLKAGRSTASTLGPPALALMFALMGLAGLVQVGRRQSS